MRWASEAKSLFVAVYWWNRYNRTTPPCICGILRCWTWSLTASCHLSSVPNRAQDSVPESKLTRLVSLFVAFFPRLVKSALLCFSLPQGAYCFPNRIYFLFSRISDSHSRRANCFNFFPISFWWLLLQFCQWHLRQSKLRPPPSDVGDNEAITSPAGSDRLDNQITI